MSPWFVSYKDTGSTLLRLFCFHYAGGGASVFRNWQKKMPDFVEVVAVQLPGREGRFSEPLFNRLDLLIQNLQYEIVPHLDKPYVFFGHSVGAIISFELMHALRRQNIRQPLLFMPSARKAPQLVNNENHIHHLSDSEFIEGLKRYDGIPKILLDDAEIMALLLPRLKADVCISETYTYEHEVVLECPIVAVGGQSDATVSENDLIVWQEQTNKKFNHRMFPGGHFFIQNAEQEILSFLYGELEYLMSEQNINRFEFC